MKKKLSLIFIASIFTLLACKNDKKVTSDMTQNPLLAVWDTKYNVPPLDKVKDEHYIPAFTESMEKHMAEIDAITNSKEAPTFINTIVALERSGALLTRVRKVFYAVNAANTNDNLQKTAKEVAPKLASHWDNIVLNDKLFNRVKLVYEEREKINLSKEDLKLLKETYKEFVRAGAALKGKDKQRLREINTKLATLSQQFGENVLNETNDFELYVSEKKDLGNLSESMLANAAEEAQKRGHEKGWSFTLQRPSINPFLRASPNRTLRQKIFDGYAMRANNNNAYDNKEVLREMAALRVERAKLLGYDTHADYVLSNNMAKTPEAVMELLDRLWTPALKMAKEERKAMAKKMKEEGVRDTFNGSDWRYYVEKIRKERYDFDESTTRPYFEFTAVLQGAFALAHRLFNLEFVKLENMPKWHEEQQVYEVLENGKHVGVLYMDFFTRKSKRGGAWMNSLRSQSKVDGKMVTPVITNNFNFPPPTKETPSLLSFREAQTLFHEFGHALHGLLSDVTYESLSGTNVPRDFVEFPSQVMENWMSEPEMLRQYAKHYKTGEVIPMELVSKMNEANRFNQGFATVEYMAAAYLDMFWHNLKDKELRDVESFEADAMKKIGLIEEIIPRYRSTYFQHIFSGGYSSGYYSYLWSEVLDADAYAAFTETGDIFNPNIAKKYRTLLSKGGSEDGMELYIAFRGRKPKIDALIKKKGF